MPLVATRGDWLQSQRRKISGKSQIGEKQASIHHHLGRLQTFLYDARVEIDTNRVENLTRLSALNRKNASFVGHDAGGFVWGRITSTICCPANV